MGAKAIMLPSAVANSSFHGLVSSGANIVALVVYGCDLNKHL
jgi:hypothetical protein